MTMIKNTTNRKIGFRGSMKWFGGKATRGLQKLGGSLMFPIAVLPFAALLSRFGALATDLGTTAAAREFGLILTRPSDAIFNNLPLIFAMGTAFGLAIDHRGEAALVGAVLFLAINLMCAEKAAPTILYKNTNTFETFKTENGSIVPVMVDGEGGKKVAQQLSSLLYIPTYVPGVQPGSTIVGGGTYGVDPGVIGGLVSGCTAAYLYNHFKDIKIPKVLAFFGGRRFVPMLALTASIPMGFMFAIIWPWIQTGLVSFGKQVSSGDAWAIPGAFLYAMINRIMQPFGMHHVINTFLWFQMPINNYLIDVNGKIVLTPELLSDPDIVTGIGSHDYSKLVTWINQSVVPNGHFKNMATITADNWQNYFSFSDTKISEHKDKIIPGANGKAVIFGDITAFTHGMLSGNFQTGYFPLYWGGLTAASAAMITTSRPENRKRVATFLIGVAVISALTGIDEPVFFAFTFVGPILWAYNALFTSIFAAIAIAMHMHVGFGFSAGLIDWIISLPRSIGMSKFENTLNGHSYGILSNPGWMFALALLMAPCYYFSFYFTIKKMNIMTPGREEEAGDLVPNIGGVSLSGDSEPKTKSKKPVNKYDVMAEEIIKIIGRDNITKVDNCATRLRLTVKNNKVGTDAQFKAVGAFGVARVNDNIIQIIIGTDVENVADRVHRILDI